MKKKEAVPAEGDSFLSRLGQPTAGVASGTSSSGPARLAPLAPPPGQPVAGFAGLMPPPPSNTHAAVPTALPPQQHMAAVDDLLGLGTAATSRAQTAAAAPAAAVNPAPAAEEGWATFD